MGFTVQTFARKLTALRKDFGQEVGDLADLSGIPEGRLALLEAAQAEPSGDELLVLADCFSREYQFFLSDEATDADADMGLLFRTRGEEISSADRLAIAEFSYLCRCQARLEREMGVKPAIPGFAFQPGHRHFKGDAARCAAALRSHLGLARNEVVRDVLGLMRDAGIKVFRRRLDNSAISGLFMRHPLAGPCILVNVAEGMQRQRFSAAHEWAHALMDGTTLNFSVASDASAADLVEVRANAFAARFLVPPDLLTEIGPALQDDPERIAEVAARLRVSAPVLLYSMVDAKLVGRQDVEGLRARVPRIPEAPDPELEGDLSPAQLQRREALMEHGLSAPYVILCLEAYDRGLVTLGLLSEMLLTTTAGAHEVAALFGRTVGIG